MAEFFNTIFPHPTLTPLSTNTPTQATLRVSTPRAQCQCHCRSFHTRKRHPRTLRASHISSKIPPHSHLSRLSHQSTPAQPPSTPSMPPDHKSPKSTANSQRTAKNIPCMSTPKQPSRNSFSKRSHPPSLRSYATKNSATPTSPP